MNRTHFHLAVSFFLCALFLTACRPKSVPQSAAPAVSQPSASAQQAISEPAPAPVADPALLLVQTALNDSEYIDNLTLTTLLEHSQGAHTLILVRIQGYPHVGGLDNLALGVWNDDTQTFVGNTLSLRGDQSRFASWEENGGLYLLLTNCSVNHGWETCQGALYFRFAEGELEAITKFPEIASSSGTPLPEASNFFLSGRDSFSRSAYWDDHKLLPAPGGMELFIRTEGWDRIPVTPDGIPVPQPQWSYEGFVPLSEDSAPPRSAVEFLRGHLEQRSYTMWDYPESAQFQIQSCTQPPESSCIDHSGTEVFRFEISSHLGEFFQRDILLDQDSGQPIGLHSGPEFSLYINGAPHSLGCEELDLFGTPYRTNYTDMDSGSGTHVQEHSQWFTKDLSPACGYTYYPSTGKYRLNNLRISLPEAQTARGIRPGSTGAELLAAYPELEQEFSHVPNYLSFYEPDTGCALEFHLDWPGDGANSTPEDWTVSEVILFAPYWYDPLCVSPVS